MSGGLDSLLLDHYLTNNLHCPHKKLWINYGQKESNEERATSKTLWPDAIVLDMVGGEASKHGRYFPNRNLWLATTASLFTDADVIWMAGIADDVCVDKTKEAFERMSEILTRYAGHRVSVESPFWNIDKSSLIGNYLQSGGTRERLLKTWSCYDPVDKRPCLNCEACFRWSMAMRSNGINVPLPSKELTKTYLKKIHTYDQKRIWSTLKGIQTSKEHVWCVDIDGTLTNETKGWDYDKRTPHETNLAHLRHAYDNGNWIVLWSSRRSVDRQVTLQWLEKNNVPYHALILDKIPYAVMVDDLSVNWTGMDPANAFLPRLG